MRSRDRRSTMDILLELLDKVPDAATLEVLLEPENLRQLLRAEGWTDDGIRQALTAERRSPGALLLEVLAREPDTTVLMRRLGDPPLRRASTTASPAVSARVARPRSAIRPAVGMLLLGALLALPSAWFLFVRLDVIHVPGLIEFFPKAYALLAALILVGTGVMIMGVRDLVLAIRRG